MKKLMLAIFFTSSALLSMSAQNVDQQSNETQSEDDVFTAVEQMPEFKGGDNALNDYIKKNLKYPETAKKNRVEGKVWIRFIVEKDGTLTNFELRRGIGGGCDEEAMRVLKAMPAWNPGKQNNTAVRTYYIYPVQFSLK